MTSIPHLTSRPDGTERIPSAQAILAEFRSYGRPRDDWKIGAEFERTVVRPDGRPVAYADPDGIRWILESLGQQGGWDRIHEEGNLIALKRDTGAHITLEPGGQVELSGAPHATLAELHAEMDENRTALLGLAQGRELRWITCGLTPVAAIEDVAWMPKARYAVMREYLPTRGPLAHFMMKGTCSIQCNYDFSDEADCALKVRAVAGLAPLTTAIYSNSPLYRNQPTGFMSYRGHIWRHTDPDRTGFPPGLRDRYDHARWVDYLLDTPMMFWLLDERYLPARGRTFRSWLQDGIDGHYPTWNDWVHHQTSVFPEVRVKRTIEVRGADCVSHELALSFCALFTGVLYCPRILDEVLVMVEDIERHGTHEERFDIACQHGLAGVVGGRPLAEWARDLGKMAERGLRNCLPDDLPLLHPLLDLLDRGRSPARDLLDRWEQDPSPEHVIRSLAY